MQCFTANHIDGAILSTITADMLKQELNIPSLGHRTEVLKRRDQVAKLQLPIRIMREKAAVGANVGPSSEQALGSRTADMLQSDANNGLSAEGDILDKVASQWIISYSDIKLGRPKSSKITNPT